MTDVAAAVERACQAMADWLRALPEWPRHPTNPSGSVSSHSGPTILSEHDCVMHFARLLNAAGVAWEDVHMELGPGQWMYTAPAGAPKPKQIDLAVIERDRLLGADLPAQPGTFVLDAVVEFALASDYWLFGSGSPTTARRKVQADVEKVGEYLRTGLSHRGYVIVVEECDHRFPANFEAVAAERFGVNVRLLRRWR